MWWGFVGGLVLVCARPYTLAQPAVVADLYPINKHINTVKKDNQVSYQEKCGRLLQQAGCMALCAGPACGPLRTLVQTGDQGGPSAAWGTLSADELALLTCAAKTGCLDPGTPVAGGSNGQVFVVQDEEQRPHIWKRFFPSEAESYTAKYAEAAKLTCPSVLGPSDMQPEVDTVVGRLHDGVVMDKLDGDAFAWLDTMTQQQRHCLPNLTRSIVDAVECLHASNYIHGDITLHNIFVRDGPECPTWWLSDFDSLSSLPSEQDPGREGRYRLAALRDDWEAMARVFQDRRLPNADRLANFLARDHLKALEAEAGSRREDRVRQATLKAR